MSFVVIRHPAAGLGTTPEDALENLRANGWMRVSEARAEPADFDLTQYADAPDLDAPAPAPAPVEQPPPAKSTSKESKA